MTHFIELTQKFVNIFSGEESKRVINVAIENIDFYYNNHIVFANRTIDVYDSYDEIKNKINESQNVELI